ncbi:MAG: hypothetical protein M0T84_01270 [Betaproteobacteria bacterium]|nr:hypothetical protein [Betaproteobacteria bacterium]
MIRSSCLLQSLMLALVLLADARQAQASNWVFIDADKHRLIQTDVDSLTRNGDVVRGTTRTTYTKAQVLPGTGVTYKYSADTYEYDCGRGFFRLLASNKVASNGYVVDSSVRADSPPVYGTAGTVGAKMFDVACTERGWLSRVLRFLH